MRAEQARKYTLYLIIITTGIRLFIAAFSGLGTGESYYVRGAVDLQLSYFDQPPLFFWISGLFVNILGLSALAVRLPAILFFAGTSWILFKISERLYNAQAGFYAAALLNMSAVFTIAVGVWFQPDAPLMFFWILTAYLISEILINNKQGLQPWIFVGVSMGLTTLSKYHVIFLLAGVLLFCLFEKNYRKWLTHPGPYLALLINVLVSLPVVIWNSQNDWVSFMFQGSRAGSQGEFQLHWDWFFRSILGQSVWVLPWIWFPLVRQLPLLYRRRGSTDLFIFWTSILPIVFFTIITLWSNLGFHFHWQAPGYLMLFIALGASVQRAMEEKKWVRLNRIWLWSSAFTTIFVVSILLIHTETGFWNKLGPKLVGQQFGVEDDPTLEGYDYDDLRHYFEQKGWMDDDQVFLASPRWWITGKMDWALRLRKDVIVFHDDPRNYAFFMDPKSEIGNDGIIVIRKGMMHTKTDFMDPFFESVHFQDSVAIMRGGIQEFYLYVYMGKQFKIPKSEVNTPLYRMLNDIPPFAK